MAALTASRSTLRMLISSRCSSRPKNSEIASLMFVNIAPSRVSLRTFRADVQGVQYALLLEALLLSAAVLYGALYWLVMPPRLHDKPLYFDHSQNDQSSMVSSV